MADPITCVAHPDKLCESYCLQCDVPLCRDCTMGIHREHKRVDIVEMESIKQVKRREIEEDNAEIQDILIPQFQMENANIEDQIAKTVIRYESIEESADVYRNDWHQEVDRIFEDYHREIHQTRDKDIALLKNYQRDIKYSLQTMPNIVQHNTEVLQSGSHTNAVIQYKSKLPALRKTLPKYEMGMSSFSTPPIQTGQGLCIEFGGIRSFLVSMSSFESLQNSMGHPTYQTRCLLERVIVKAEFSSEVDNLQHIVYNGRNEVWLSGKDGTIRHMNIHGIDLQTLEATNTKYQDIAVNSEGELIYSDYINKCVNIVRGTETEILFESEYAWHPQGIFCTREGHILVTMRVAGDSCCKLVRYNGEKVIQEIQYDKFGNCLFSRGYKCVFIAENNNGDLCASDTNSCSLVVVDKAGDFRYRYCCDPTLRRKPFVPHHIVTDSQCHIILTDYVNNCLHIFHKDSQYLKCISHPDLDLPVALTIDNDDKLWVGLYVSGKVKVIQYMK